MGNCIQSVSANVTVIADDQTWIEDNAIQQLIKTCQLPGITQAMGMPDLHPGRGYPIGAVFLSQHRIYPALIGNDIGCGMALWSTNLLIRKIKLDKLEKRLGNIDAPLDDDWHESISDRLHDAGVTAGDFRAAIGTIGSGNHFAELQQVDTLYDDAYATRLGLDKSTATLLVHSGSRGLGQQILRTHVARYSHQGLAVGSPECEDYLAQHNQALSFAKINREFIARRLLNHIGATGHCLSDVNHNLLEPYHGDPLSGWIHRKGATPADKGVVMIPGSRGDYSYLVAPTQSHDSLLSLAHGAGRKWIRSGCQSRLSTKYSAEQLKRTAFGSRVICDNKALLFEEAPQAYKAIDNVIGVMVEAGLMTLIARFKPLLTYKTRGAN